MLKEPIFLSASIPDRAPYTLDSDPIAIREAILALVAVAVRDRHLVFGGGQWQRAHTVHPHIRPGTPFRWMERR